MFARLMGRMMDIGPASARHAADGARKVAKPFMAALFAIVPPALAAPVLYHARELQSPVRIGAGDLLLLAGADLSPDDDIILRAASGEIIDGVEVVRAASDQKALVLRMPAPLETGRRSFISVAMGDSRSNEVALNDARPAWLSPGSLPTSGASPGLSREIKIVGRNLDPAGIAATLVRLRGPRELTLTTSPASVQSANLNEFVARVAVPNLPTGVYSIAISRDSLHWADVPASLRIDAVPAPKAELPIAAAEFGACRADDALDDTPCIVAAIAAAQRRGGATVRFGAGEWRLDNPSAPGSANDGIVVPRGVDLAGNSAHTARLVRGAAWLGSTAKATFTLLGDNVVSGLVFADDTRQRTSKEAPPVLQVGSTWSQVEAGSSEAARTTENIVISDNRFAGSAVSIHDGGMPIRRLVITQNRFRAYRLALAFGGDSNNVRDTFRIEDSVIARNLFEPGSYLDAATGQGARATEFGAGERVDFSGNVANGAAIGGLDSPADARGWRAAFFWHLQGPQEHLLIADNEVSCSGDKAGDGEAIALDSNHNTFALSGALSVLTADANSVSILGPVLARQDNHAIDFKAFYRGHWLQIAEGRGVGQSRRIEAIDYDADSRRTKFQVAPAWDVVPAPRDSRVVVGRAFWQALVVANRIDHRQPLCRKSNRSAPRGGAIVVWAQTSDSVVAFNRQFDTNGIAFQQLSKLGATNMKSFLEIRGNAIHGEYASGHSGSRQGIQGSHGAGTDEQPPIASFGVMITGNEVTAATTARDPAISLPVTWYRGPAPHNWTLIDRLLIYKNVIQGGGTGIEVGAEALVRRTVLLANRCAGVARPIRGGAPQIISLCPVRDRSYCECGDVD